MKQGQVHIRDAMSAANAYAAMANLGAPAKFPADAAELKRRLKRVSGRGRELAAALQAFVDAEGFDAVAKAASSSGIGRRSFHDANGGEDTARADIEAAAAPGSLSVAELDDATLTFAASGLY